MSRQEMRFRPPAMEIDRECRWILHRAFGPQTAPAPDGPLESSRLGRHLGALALAPRVASRLPEATLAAEAGPEVAAGLRRQRLATVAQEMRLGQVAAELAEAARSLGLPLAWLKFEALRRSGILTSGGRGAGDVDLLVEAERGKELQDLLLARGFAPSGLPEKEHQLSPLTHPSGVPIEVHRLILGVRPRPAAPSYGFADLSLDGHLELCAEDGLELLPKPAILVAHALVHGLAHHGDAPHAYPAFRMVSDLIDLGFGEDVEQVDQAHIWLARDLSRQEIQAAWSLCRGLRRGELESFASEDGAVCLLRHLLAGALDESYRRALRFRVVGHPLSDRSPTAAALAGVWGTLFPSRAQIDLIYGPPKSGRPRGAWGYWGRRLWRPVDLLRRAANYAWHGGRTARLRPRHGASREQESTAPQGRQTD